MVHGHGRAGLADENSTTEKGLAKLLASRTAYILYTIINSVSTVL